MFGQHPADDDIQVQLAHAGDNILTGFFIIGYFKGRVLFGQFLERVHHLVLVGAGLGFDRDGDHRLGELDVLQKHRVGRVAQGVARKCIFKAEGGDDGAGIGFGYFLAGVGMHHQ